MENCPWKVLILYVKWPIILQFEVVSGLLGESAT